MVMEAPAEGRVLEAPRPYPATSNVAFALELELARLELNGERWIEARAGGRRGRLNELEQEFKRIERNTRKLERKLHKQRPRPLP